MDVKNNERPAESYAKTGEDITVKTQDGGRTLINSYADGLRDGIAIGLGYLSVSFTFGLMAAAGGLPALAAIAISMTNLTSAGQFAGLDLILHGGSLIETALTQLVINLRYALMSISVSQKLDKKVSNLQRLIMAFGITDEIFAVATTKAGYVGSRYMYGLITIPYLGWAIGTALGALVGAVVPNSIGDALGIAIYGMFIAIIVPPAKGNRNIIYVIIIAVVLSSCFEYIPVLSGVSSGFALIISAVSAALAGAIFAPVKDDLDDAAGERTERTNES